MRKLLSFFTLALMCVATISAATNIKGTQVATVDRMYQFVKSKNANFDPEIAKYFYSVGAKYGIRGDIAICQSCVETGYFKYPSPTAVTPEDHNYCGLGVTTTGKKGCIFDTVEEGVTAQIQHLYAYCCKDAIPSGETLIDPRFNYVTRGCATTWEALGGKWATGTTYGTQILSVYNTMMSYSVVDPSIEASSTSLTMSADYNGTSPTKSVTITGNYLLSDIVYNSNTSAFKVTTGSDWNKYEGGTLNISLDTSKAPGNYSGYIAVQSGSGSDIKRVEINITATIKDPNDPLIAVEPTTISLTGKQGEANPSANIIVTAMNLNTAITYSVSNSAFIVTPGSDWNTTTGGSLNVALDTSKEIGSYSGILTINSGSDVTTKVTLSGNVVGADPVPLNLEEIWNYSMKKANTTTPGYDATKIRNFAYHDGVLYCVYNHSSIKMIDARTGADLGDLSNGDIVSGGTLNLCDVEVVDGHIIACNLASSTAELRIYCWDSKTATPYLLMSTTDLQGSTRVGDCMEASGSFGSSLRLTFGNDDGTTARIIEYTYDGSAWNASSVKVLDGTSRYELSSTMRAIVGNGGWWVDGKGAVPAWVTYDSSKSAAVVQYKNSYTGKTHGSVNREFEYGGGKYSANLIFAGSTNYTQPCMRLILDNSSNYSDITEIGNYPTDGLGDNADNTGACGDVLINTDGYSYLEAWVVSYLQGLCYYRSGTITDVIDPEPTPDPTPDPGVDVAIPDVFTTDWEYSAVKGNSCSFMDPSTDMTRNMVLKGDNLYILQRESSDCNIHIVDAMTGTDKGNLPCTGITADKFKFFSVGNLGGTIVACSAATSGESTLKVYAWDSDSATPTVVLETTNHGTRAGDYMSCSGDINNGKLYFTNNDTSGNVYVYTVTNGKASATPTVITLKKADGTTAYGINDGVAVLDVRAQDDGTIICTGKGGMPTRFTAEGTYKEALTAAALDNNTIGTCYYPFTYGQYTLAAAVTYTTGAKQGYLNLLNVTDGITKATKIHSYGALGKADVANGTFVTTAIAKPEGDGIHLWVLIPKQGIAKYSATTINSAVESIEALDSREILCTTTGFYATDARITVVNLSGVIVAEGYDHIDKASLAPGFYVVTATYADGMKLAKKVAVR